MTRAAVWRDLVIVACAIGAGVHAALAPAHGARFAAAAVLLAALALALTRRPTPALLLTAVVLLVATGLPLLRHDGLGLVTGSVELLGLVAALRLLRGGPGAAPRPIPIGLTALIACFSAFAALALTGGHGGHAPDGGHAQHMRAGA